MVAIFPKVCLWRRSYAQNWELLTLKNCYSIETPSYASTAYVAASYGPRFFSTVRFVNLREFFWANQFTAPPGKKFPLRLWLQLSRNNSIGNACYAGFSPPQRPVFRRSLARSLSHACSRVLSSHDRPLFAAFPLLLRDILDLLLL